MPIDPSMLANSIGTLTDLHPEKDLTATLQDAVIAAKQLFEADAAGIMLVDIDGQLRWASASDQRLVHPRISSLNVWGLSSSRTWEGQDVDSGTVGVER